MKGETRKWTEFMTDIGMRQAELFNANNIPYMELMVNGISLKNLLNSCYKSLIVTKKIVPIENLPTEEKQRLFEIIKEFEKECEPLDKDGVIHACRAMHSLGYYLTQLP